jgi:L-lactate dehydrogenase complex protein LldF
VVGIDKVVPDWESLTVLLKLLARSATGQKISTYTAFINGPRRQAGEHGPKEFHLVMLDNGRSQVLQDPVGREVLKCIRCGCCLNVCPVYKSVGGYAYGWFISGPIGAIFSPQILGTEAGRELPYASTLCGACADVCPVKIPIPKILLHLRHRVAEGDPFGGPAIPATASAAGWAGGLALRIPWLYRLGTRLLPYFTAPWRKDGWLHRLPAPLNRWTDVRPLPAFGGNFRRWWQKRTK